MKTAFCFFFTMINIHAFAQKSIGLTLSDIPSPPQYHKPFEAVKKPLLVMPNNSSQLKSTPRPAAIPLVFSVDKLPFFCKIEHKINVQQALPVKFRLGSVEYVDKLEGKSKVKIQE